MLALPSRPFVLSNQHSLGYAPSDTSTTTKFILSSAWGGAPRVPPLRHQFPSLGPVGHPHALPFGMSRALNTTTQTPSGRGSRAALPGPLGPALVLTPPPHPWSPGRQGPLGGTQGQRGKRGRWERQGGQGLSPSLRSRRSGAAAGCISWFRLVERRVHVARGKVSGVLRVVTLSLWGSREY